MNLLIAYALIALGMLVSYKLGQIRERIKSIKKIRKKISEIREQTEKIRSEYIKRSK